MGKGKDADDRSSASGQSNAQDLHDLFEHLRGQESDSEAQHHMFGLGWNLMRKNGTGSSLQITVPAVVMVFSQLFSFVFSVDTYITSSAHFTSFLYVAEVARVEYLVAKGSFAGYVVIFSILFAVTVCILGVVGHIAKRYQEEVFPYPGLIEAMRWMIVVMGKFMYVSALGMAITLLDCSTLVGGSSVMTIYPDVVCWTGRHSVLAAAGGISMGFIFVTGALAVILLIDFNPKALSIFASPHWNIHLIELICTTLMVICSVVISKTSIIWPIVMVACFGCVLQFLVRRVPYYNAWMNKAQIAGYSVLFQAALVTLIGRIVLSVHDTSTVRVIITVLVFALMPLFGCVGFGIAHFRLSRLHGIQMYRQMQIQEARRGVTEKRVYAVYEYEVASRFVYSEKGLTDGHLELVENLFLNGVITYPKSVWMHLLYSTFIAEIRQNGNRAETIRKGTQGKPCTKFEKFARFIQMQNHRDKIIESDSRGSEATDLAITLSKKFKKISAGLDRFEKTQFYFFKTLASRKVHPKKLRDIMAQLARLRKELTDEVGLMLKQHSTTVPVLRLYARFLIVVSLEARTGISFYNEADRVEAENQKDRYQRSMFDLRAHQIDDCIDRIISIDRFGTIQRATTRLAHMFGYETADELIGNNVSIIVPPPHCIAHDQYLKRFNDGIKSKGIMHKERMILGQHAEGHTFPAKIFLSDIAEPQTSEAFIARFVPPKKNEMSEYDTTHEPAFCAADMDGQIESFNLNFCGFFGITPSEIKGASIFDIINPGRYESVFDIPEESADCELVFKDVKVSNVALTAKLMGNQQRRIVIIGFRLQYKREVDPTKLGVAKKQIIGTEFLDSIEEKAQEKLQSVEIRVSSIKEEENEDKEEEEVEEESDDEKLDLGDDSFGAPMPKILSPQMESQKFGQFNNEDTAEEPHMDAENREQIQRLKRRDAIAASLARSRSSNYVEIAGTWIRWTFVFCVCFHFACFGGLWSRGNGFLSDLNHSNSISLMQKHAMMTALYARVARSGSPLLSTNNALLLMLNNAVAFRDNALKLAGAPQGARMRQTPLSISAISGNKLLVTESMNLWALSQEYAASAISLTDTTIKTAEPPREWMFLMMNGPSVLFNALQEAHDSEISRIQSLYMQHIGLIVGLLCIEMLTMIFVVFFGFSPLADRVATFRVMMARILLSIPRGTCKSMSVKKEVTDWTATQSQSNILKRVNSGLSDDGGNDGITEENADSTSSGSGSDDESEATDVKEQIANLWNNNNNIAHGGSLVNRGNKRNVGGKPNDNNVNRINNAVAINPWMNNGFAFGGTNVDASDSDYDGNSKARSKRRRKKKAEAENNNNNNNNGADGKGMSLKNRILKSTMMRRVMLLIQASGEKIAVTRGKETVVFDSSLDERFMILSLITAALLTVTATYIIFLFTSITLKKLEDILDLLVSLMAWNHRCEFFAHELAGGWSLIPDSLLQHQTAMTTVGSILQQIMHGASMGDSKHLFIHETCFADSGCVDPTAAPVVGLETLNLYWIRESHNFADCLLSRQNMTLSGNATSFLPIPDACTQAPLVLQDGIQKIEYSLNNEYLTLSATLIINSTEITAHIVILALILSSPLLLDWAFLHRVKKSVTDEMNEGVFLLSTLPDYVGILKICAQERKKSFGE